MMDVHDDYNVCVRVAINRIPPVLKSYYNLKWLANKRLAMRICRKILSRIGIMSPVPSTTTAGKRFTPPEGVLGLSPGDYVEINSAEEIRKTLDVYGRHDRLYFMAEQWQFCGKKFRVYKRVNRVLSEQTGAFKRARNVVLLEGVCCDGSHHKNCDASCFLFWKEAWLRRVEP
ncbi:MAG: hypothetical protein H6Q52_3436 [Deltaproteobacteria bacterium]|nr:hypothetical protein [Deltaproteobacteria bacterium]